MPASAIASAEPLVTSMRVKVRSSVREPFSTTCDCRKNCMYGEIVVPITVTTIAEPTGLVQLEVRDERATVTT